MLREADLTKKTTKGKYRGAIEGMRLEVGRLQREAHQRGVPVVIVFEGWGGSGKGTLINALMQAMDPRGFKVWSTPDPTEEERFRPLLWRFWTQMPARGRFAIFDRSWYRRVLDESVVPTGALRQEEAVRDILAFERQLTDDGVVLIKFFLHISRKEQKRRFSELRADEATAWRVSKQDLRRHRNYARYVDAAEALLSRTHDACAPWTVVEAHDRCFAELKVFRTVLRALETGLSRASSSATAKAAATPGARPAIRSPLSAVDLSLRLPKDEYRRKVEKRQETLRDLEFRIYRRRLPVVIVYEGWDAAGKGGNIRRLTQRLDPRGYEVIPVTAPTPAERAHHYLWRFWNQIPKAGHVTIFDRSWYGRVLVERVEAFCTEAEWMRAYREINEMEQHWTDFGIVLVKLWMHIDRAEQLRRFRDRRSSPEKQWKITAEDWRNRAKWKDYAAAADEMLLRTSTPHAPWTIVESNCKYHARIKAMDTVIRAVSRALKARGA